MEHEPVCLEPHAYQPTGPRPPVSLDFDPRPLAVTLSLPTREDRPYCSLDAVFIPVRGRPHYLSQLLADLPESDTPIFLLPTDPSDLVDVQGQRKGAIHVLQMTDPEFLALLQQMRCPTHVFSTAYSSAWDLPAKRSYALWYARIHHMQRILLLDDDIRGLAAAPLPTAVRALSSFTIAGFFVEDFADTSALGHVEIALGDSVSTFLSGSCLFVRSDGDTGFFPPIYNEDWLFMAPEIATRHVCSVGRIRQKPYDPFANPSLASFQEFGEVLADGLFALVACGRYGDRFTLETWRELLDLRRKALAEIASRCSDPRHVAVVMAARATFESVTEWDCLRFVTDYELDRYLWNRTLRGLG